MKHAVECSSGLQAVHVGDGEWSIDYKLVRLKIMQNQAAGSVCEGPQEKVPPEARLQSIRMSQILGKRQSPICSRHFCWQWREHARRSPCY